MDVERESGRPKWKDIIIEICWDGKQHQRQKGVGSCFLWRKVSLLNLFRKIDLFNDSFCRLQQCFHLTHTHTHTHTHTKKKRYTEHKLLPRPSQFPDLNPIENECGELTKRCTNMELRIWRIWNDYIRRNGLIALSLAALFTEVMWAFTVLHGSHDEYCMNSMC